ncbi:OmpA family protein [Catalinimonas niigatensis]|uniref:OmpA family protein n=1 Tax=Catalinimonas niigatensis TaxID=1397264 RepID=UPI002666DF0D|nr:OmpA family protein [Catalinimonas niigatensis]WPP51521.1 OmpA family protein [Catalinimonas niigatensis]
MRVSNDLFKLLFICFFICGHTNSTITLNEEIKGNKKAIIRYGQEPDALHTGNYLIIGVFEYEKNARRFTNKALKDGLKADYKFYSKTGFFYVYTNSDSVRDDMIEAYQYLRNKTSYNDAWIFTVQDEKPEIEYKPKDKEISYGQPFVVASDLEHKDKPEPASLLHVDQMVVVFETINHQTGDSVNTEIQLVDSRKARLIEKLGQNQTWNFSKQEFALDTVQVIAQALGYRKFQIDWAVSSPLNDSANYFTSIRNDTLIVHLPLMELEVGDVQVMYNTYFYGNSTVMRIQSMYELEELYKALNRNPAMKIKLHGHTNGNFRGIVYLYLEEAKNFFELARTKEYKKRSVSSTSLSASRAETIKSYLTHLGIAPERIETVGWGGKKMLYEQDSPMAKNNIRVEIEVLSK